MKLTSTAPFLFALLTGTGFGQAYVPGFVVNVTPVPPPTVTLDPVRTVAPVPIAAPVPVVSVAARGPQVGETNLTLDTNTGVRPVVASRVTVPVGEKLCITGPDAGGRRVRWYKDGVLLSETTRNTLNIGYVTTAESGTYSMSTIDAQGVELPSQALVLGVGPTDRLLNLSTRVPLGATSDQAVTVGFVVASGAVPKKLIVRAIGPSLSQFGVANALRRPVLEILDAAGKAYTDTYAYAAVAGGLTFETDLADSLAKAGAFPTLPGSGDVVRMMPFKPGAYSARVTSGDGTSGTALLEIYEVP